MLLETEGEGVNQTVGVRQTRSHTLNQQSLVKAGDVSMWGKTIEKDTQKIQTQKKKRKTDQKCVCVLFDLARVSK